MSPEKSGVPGVVGTRCLQDNLSDLKAQVAANSKGITLVKGLIAEYSLPVVQSYMQHIQSNAEAAVRSMLVKFSHSQVLLPAHLPLVCCVCNVVGLQDGSLGSQVALPPPVFCLSVSTILSVSDHSDHSVYYCCRRPCNPVPFLQS